MTADLMDLRMHHHLALQTEFYRMQMQRLPGKLGTIGRELIHRLGLIDIGWGGN